MESETQKTQVSRLLQLNYRFDSPNELDEKLGNHFYFLMESLHGMSEKEAYEWLMQRARDPKFVEVTAGGFLYGILTDTTSAPKHFRNMGVCVTDNWYTALYTMNMILLELFHKMKPEPQMQIIYFFREAVKSNMPKIDNVLINLLRVTHEGSGTKFVEIIPFVRGVAEFLNENCEWIRTLKQGSVVPPLALLTFSRFLHDYTVAGLIDEPFKKTMESICEFFLRERFADMMTLGRDLVLIMMRIGRYAAFTPFWKNFLYKPSALMPNFGGIPDIMNKPCQNVIFNYRLSLQVTRKLDFLLKMKMPNFTRHLDWFSKLHLTGPDGGSIRAEILRYLCLVIPDLQQPHVVESRAQLVHYFLKNANPGPELQWCKLVLIWDWFGFDSNVPNAASIVEPAFSFVRYLLTANPPLGNGIIDFLIKSVATILPSHKEFFVKSVTNCFKQISAFTQLSCVLDNTRLDKPLRDLMRDTFPDLFPAKQPPSVKEPSPIPQILPAIAGSLQPAVITLEESPEKKPETPKEKKKEKKKVKRTASLSAQSPEMKRENILDVGTIESALPSLREEFRRPVEELDSAVKFKGDEQEAIQKLLMCIFENDELLESYQYETLAEVFLIIYREFLSKREFFPSSHRGEEAINEVFEMSFFALFRQMIMADDPSRKLLLNIIVEMRERCNCIGYLLLIFIKASKGDTDDTPLAYTELCRVMCQSLEDQLIEDLNQCVIDDYKLFAYLIPFIFEKLPEVTGSVNLMRLICGSIDASQALNIVREMCLENLILFRKDTIMPILTASLQWDTIEQMILWTLIRAEGVGIDWVMNIIHRLVYNKHAEAITNLLLILKTERIPSARLIQALLSRPVNDFFTTCAIKILIEDDEGLERVAELISTLIRKFIQSGDLYQSSPTKDKSAKKTLCLELVLSHLDTFRTNCLTKSSRRAESLLSNGMLQEAFTAAKRNAKITDLRVKFTELFAVMEIFSDSMDANRPRRKTARQTKVDYTERDVKRRKIKEEDSDED